MECRGSGVWSVGVRRVSDEVSGLGVGQSIAMTGEVRPPERVETAVASVAKPAVVARWLAMGTADPHGVGDEDRVKPGRVPALRLGSQSMASGAELMRRPTPVANVPPDTGPREPPAPPIGGAPIVTAVEQVIPAHVIVIVSRWRRQLTRCLWAAGRGDLSLARRQSAVRPVPNRGAKV